MLFSIKRQKNAIPPQIYDEIDIVSYHSIIPELDKKGIKINSYICGVIVLDRGV